MDTNDQAASARTGQALSIEAGVGVGTRTGARIGWAEILTDKVNSINWSTIIITGSIGPTHTHKID